MSESPLFRRRVRAHNVGMADHPDGTPAHPSEPTGAEKSLRAQILATDHWSLLASRSTTQSEVLSRITIFLTLVSASLVSLALIGQANQFSHSFATVAIVLLSFVLVVGVLTQVRVVNVALDDMMFVISMNRIRAAYVELDPQVRPFLLSGYTDDLPGVQRTYYFPGGRDVTQVLGSSMVFTIAVNAALAGVLTAAIALTAGAAFSAAVALAIAVGVVYLTLSIWVGGRLYSAFWRGYEPLAAS
jgi:hypothetical protein